MSSGLIGTSHSKSRVIGRSKDTCKAWANWTGTSSESGYFNLQDSFNVSSVADVATGKALVNLLTPMSNINYAVGGMAGTEAAGDTSAISGFQEAPLTTRVYVYITSITGIASDRARNCIIVFGD